MLVVFLSAVVVPDLGTVFSITGGTSVVCLIFSFPLSFLLKLWYSPHILGDLMSNGYEALIQNRLDHAAKTEPCDVTKDAEVTKIGDESQANVASTQSCLGINWALLLVTPVLGLWATGATIYRVTTGVTAVC